MARIKHALLVLAVCIPSLTFAQRENNLIPAKWYDKWGFIDNEGAWVIPARYDKAYHFTEGLAAVEYYDKWGYINNDGEWVIEPAFTDAKPFSEGLACTVQDGKWGYITKKGKWHFEPQYFVVSSFSEGKALVKDISGFIFIDKSGNKIIDRDFDYALPFSEGLASVKDEGFRGYIDIYGNWVIRHNYEEAFSFSEGMALVKRGMTYGYIDMAGQEIISPRYDDANHFKEGKAAVQINGKWGYVDEQGEIVIGNRYDRAFSFSEGFAAVKSAYKFGLIDEHGSWKLNPVYKGLGRYTSSVSHEAQIIELAQKKFATWQLKGEFEKSSDYVERISAETQQQTLDRITQEAINHHARKHIDLNEAKLGLYNADIERFNLFIPGVRKIYLPVPIDVAPDIKKNWKKVWLGSTNYTIDGDEFLLTKMEIKFNGHLFTYDINQPYEGGEIMELPDISDQVNFSLPKINPIYLPPSEPINLTLIGQSDVDKNIPVTNFVNENTFALVIGNQDYVSYQPDLSVESNVDFAEIDAKKFAEYLQKTAGVPAQNIDLILNATAGQMRQAFGKLNKIAKAYDGEARIIFYYAGHGLPNEVTREPYLIPVDVSGINLEYAIKLENVYNRLTEFETQGVTVFLDACFSGGGRNKSLVASRGVRIKPKSPFVNGKLVVFSASSKEQNAYPYYDKAHGMFTYYLLKGLQMSDGRISYGELDEFIHTNVKRKSVTENNKVQEPVTNVSPAIQDQWESLRFVY